MNELRDKAHFKSTLDEIFEAFKPRTDPTASPSFIGAAYGEPLEHTTRKYVIDILSGLGWDLGCLTREIVEEARIQGDSTLFLDYLGINPAQGSPLAIVEAKAWAKPFVTASNAGAAAAVRGNPSSPEALIAEAIEHFKRGGQPQESPVALEWAKWIDADGRPGVGMRRRRLRPTKAGRARCSCPPCRTRPRESPISFKLPLAKVATGRESVRDGLESSRKSRIEIGQIAASLVLIFEEVILMPASNIPAAASQAWVVRAERARRIAAMLSSKDAEAIEAYAKECEAIARQTIDRQVMPPLAA